MANNPVEELSNKEEKKYVFKDPTFDVRIIIKNPQIVFVISFNLDNYFHLNNVSFFCKKNKFSMIKNYLILNH